MKRLTDEERKERKKEKNKRLAAYLREKAKKEDDFYFGAGNKKLKTNKYYTIKHVLNDDEIIINTHDVRFINGNAVFPLSHHHGIYLKDWQIKTVHNYDDICSNFYLVKLKREYFKPYFFSKHMFDDLCFENDYKDGIDELGFDYYLNIAKSQDERGMTLANGHMNI